MFSVPKVNWWSLLPELRITDPGPVDVNKFRIVDLFA